MTFLSSQWKKKHATLGKMKVWGIATYNFIIPASRLFSIFVMVWLYTRRLHFFTVAIRVCLSWHHLFSGTKRFIPRDNGKLLKKTEWTTAEVLKFSCDIVQIFLQHRNSTKNSSAVFVTQGYFFKSFDVREGML